MAKTNAKRQNLYRLNLSKDKVKAEKVRKKVRLRDNTIRKHLNAKSLEKLHKKISTKIKIKSFK